MPIKLADVIENLDNTYPLIDAGYNPVNGITKSPIKGFGIFEDIANGRDNLHSQRRIDGYLSVVVGTPDLYIFDGTGGSWATAADHKRVLHSGNYKDIFRISDYTALTVPAGETAGTYLTDQYTSALLLIESNPAEEPEKITISQLFEALAVSIVTENVNNGAGSFDSYGGTVGVGNPADINGDGLVGVDDVLVVLSGFDLTYEAVTKGTRIVSQTLADHPSYQLVNWTPTQNATSTPFPLVTSGNGVSVTTSPNNSDTVSVTISSDGYHTFTDGGAYEIAVGAGTIGAQQFGFQWPVLQFLNVSGGSISLLYFYLTIGRQEDDFTWTDYTGMIAAYQVGIDADISAGFIDDQIGNYVLADNMAGQPFTVIPPGPSFVEANVGASDLPLTTFIPGAQSAEYDLSLFWENLSAAAGDNLSFWVADMRAVRAKFHYTQSSGSTYEIVTQFPWKFTCKP